MTHLVVERCGPGTTLQDAGRFGWQRYGIGPAGAMDRALMAAANLLAGNAADTAAIEFALAGGRFRVEGGAVRVALGTLDAELKIDGRLIAPCSSATAHYGQTIDVSTLRAGMYAYLATAGGLAVPAELGAIATHVRAGLGGLGGRALRAGDRLACAAAPPEGSDLAAPAPPISEPASDPIRVMLGPQADYFDAAGLATFLGETYTVTMQVDRMGIRLAGSRIAHGAMGSNIVSDGIATGSIQVPGSGEPLVLLADRQTTGGYPKIATVISADLGRLAQMRPGSAIRFAAVSRTAAIAALDAQRRRLAAFAHSLRPAGADADLSSERLLAINLVDGWTYGPH